MKLTSFIALIVICYCSINCQAQTAQTASQLIGMGEMPAVARAQDNSLHVVFGNGDSILYAYSSNHGRSFSRPGLVGILSGLAASHTRGPQIAATSNGVLITACNKSGNVFAYIRDKSGRWSPAGRVNDVKDMGREQLMALGADGRNAFAVWLDLRDGRNRIYGARSIDGGRTWEKNILVYASPDSTVCECCKPSVAVKGKDVYVMFRNWLGGNRDLYLAHSADGGKTFGAAKKLGNGHWALNACPMDGGGLTISKNGQPETVWRRQSTIYACTPGGQELALGEGRSCTVESVDGKNVYAWTKDGRVVVSHQPALTSTVGKGLLPVLKSVDNGHVICVWEDEKKIQWAVLAL